MDISGCVSLKAAVSNEFGYLGIKSNITQLVIEMFCIKAVPEKREIFYQKVYISVISDFYKHNDFLIPIGLMISSSIFLKQSSLSGISTQFD